MNPIKITVVSNNCCTINIQTKKTDKIIRIIEPSSTNIDTSEKIILKNMGNLDNGIY